MKQAFLFSIIAIAGLALVGCGGSGPAGDSVLNNAKNELKGNDLGNADMELEFPVDSIDADANEGGDGKELDGDKKSLEIIYDGQNVFWTNHEYPFKAVVKLDDGSIANGGDVKWSVEGAIGFIDQNGVFSAMAPGKGLIRAELKSGKKLISAHYDLTVRTQKKELLQIANP